MIIKCRTCGREVKPANNRLKCCGFDEDYENARRANEDHDRKKRQHRKRITEQVDALLPEVEDYL